MTARVVITIIKADGSHAPLDRRKLERSIRRIGASRALAREVTDAVVREVRDGMTTREIHARVIRALRERRERRVVFRYSLKDAMRRLGPEGFHFERFVAAVLRAHGYDAELPDLLHGARCEQEVDVIARKGKVVAMIEAKYRNAPGLHVHLKDVMATWARFLDLREAHRLGRNATRLTEPWIITNTKVTADGIAFGEYYGVQIIGWEYPRDAGLERMVIEKHLFPLTVLRSVTAEFREAFAAAGIILCHDIAGTTVAALARSTGIPEPQLLRVQHEVAEALRC